MRNFALYLDTDLVRRILSIVLLLAYLGTISTTLAPLVYYISHQDYISQNLCENRDQVDLECNGKCYLNEKLSETTQKRNQENRIDIEKYPELISLSVFSKVFSCNHFVLAYPIFCNLYSFDCINDVFHPPTNIIIFSDCFC